MFQPFGITKLHIMHTTSNPGIESVIRDYIENRERFLFYGKKRMDAEKEYNRLLTKYNGEEKLYNLDHANSIYRAYCDMIAYGEQASQAQNNFMVSEERLKEIGQILFEATITADIAMTPAINGGTPVSRMVRVVYNNGQVLVH